MFRLENFVWETSRPSATGPSVSNNAAAFLLATLSLPGFPSIAQARLRRHGTSHFILAAYSRNSRNHRAFQPFFLGGVGSSSGTDEFMVGLEGCGYTGFVFVFNHVRCKLIEGRLTVEFYRERVFFGRGVSLFVAKHRLVSFRILLIVISYELC